MSKENEVVAVQDTEMVVVKKGFFARVSEKITGFSQKHPFLSGMIAGGAATAGAFAIGNAVSKRKSDDFDVDVVMDSIEPTLLEPESVPFDVTCPEL